MKIDLYTHEMPSVFARFREIVGERHWRKRVDSIKVDWKGRPYLRDLLQEINAIAVALDRCSSLTSRYGQLADIHTRDRSLYPAFQLAAQTLSIMDAVPSDQARRFVRRLHGAFKNPDDMRAVQLELGVATHFIRRGNQVSWPEIDNTGSFDLLVHDIGTEGLEVECKSVSNDCGRRIHKRDALEFNHLIRQEVEVLASKLHSGLAVILTVPERLPTGFNDRQALAREVRRAIVSGRNSMLADGSDIRILEFDVSKYPNLGPPDSAAVRDDINNITGTENRATMILGRKNGGALVFVVKSSQDDTLLSYIFKTAGDAARSQLSGNRAGIIVVELDGISADGLTRTAQQDMNPSERPTALRVEVDRFLDGSSKAHVVGISFMSRDELVEKASGHLSVGGSVYHFPKRDSRFWHNDFSGMFAEA